MITRFSTRKKINELLTSEEEPWQEISGEDIDPMEGWLLGEIPFRVPWSQIEQEMRKSAIFSGYSSYTLRPVIVKANDDLR